jgi:ATP-dependent Clp protease ATP-binding subunit ClpC
MFERFTDRSRRVVVLAQEEARLLGHNHIGTEHLLLGLIAEEESVAARTLRALGVTLDAARDQVRQVIGPGHQDPASHIPFTPRAKKVLELSLREALSLKSGYIGTEHLLLGLITEGKGVGAQILVEFGATPQAVRDKATELAEAEPDPTPTPTPAPAPAPAEPQPAPFALRQRATEIRDLLVSIDRRLTVIEQHLGIGEPPEEPGTAPPAAYDAQ